MNNDKVKEHLYDVETPVEALRKTIFDCSIDIGAEVAEIGIDQLLEDSIIKDIPIFGTLYRAGKMICAFRDIFLVKKVIIFTQKIQNGTINKENIYKHKQLLMRKPKRMYMELEIILSHLEKHSKYIKSLILANFYLLYIDYDINFEWDDFEFFAEIIDNISVFDLEILKDIFTKKFFSENSRYEFNALALKRLNVCGLVAYFDGMSVTSDAIQGSIVAHITSIGEYFWIHGMNGITINSRIDEEEMIL